MSMAKPKVGDKVYVPTMLHLSHGVDDFQGGLCTVGDTKEDIIKGQPCTFVFIEEDGSWFNWDTYLAPQQDALSQEYGDRKGRPKPDYRGEFND
jgi:hypothetical protein